MSTKAVSMPGVLMTWLALMALAALSWAVSYAKLGVFETPVAICIALMKATLVVWIFMELVEQSFAVRVTLATGVVLIALLTSLLAADVVTRPVAPAYTPPTPSGWLHAGSAAE